MTSKKSTVLFTMLILMVFTLSGIAVGASSKQLRYLGQPLLFPQFQINGTASIFKDVAEFNKTTTNDSGFAINTQDRNAVIIFYNDVFLASENVAINWTGNYDTCNAGDTSQAYKDAIMRRINYFRAMAGVPANIQSFATYNTKAQAAALMMVVNSKIDHFPTTDWTCYSADGAEAAGSSNLALGVFGPDAIDGYIKDYGTNNYPVGHRRWLLYPQTEKMGTGDVPSSNALWVMDDNIWNLRPETRNHYVAWPPPGYVPYQVVYPRWSFSYPNADFSKATVKMTSAGKDLQVTQETPHNGYGENTLVWLPLPLDTYDEWPIPIIDTTYTVTIDNVTIDSLTRKFIYNVIVMNMSNTSPPPPVTQNSIIVPPIILLLLGSDT